MEEAGGGEGRGGKAEVANGGKTTQRLGVLHVAGVVTGLGGGGGGGARHVKGGRTARRPTTARQRIRHVLRHRLLGAAHRLQAALRQTVMQDMRRGHFLGHGKVESFGGHRKVSLIHVHVD